MSTANRRQVRALGCLMLWVVAGTFASRAAWAQQGPFRVEEASIPDIHTAIRSGQTSCRQIVQAYIDRAKAYNGACTALVTRDGAPIRPATGVVRAGTAIRYPTHTVPVSSVFPDFDRYAGPVAIPSDGAVEMRAARIVLKSGREWVSVADRA